MAGGSWNYGILLLVSKNDRKARIELGAGWRRDQDLAAQGIMQQQIIPRFKQGKFSAGILAGVESLDKVARDLRLPGAAKTTATPRAAPAGGSPQTIPPASAHRFGEQSHPYPQRSSGGGGWFLIIVLVIGLGLVFMVISGIASLFRSSGGGGYRGGYSGGQGGMGWGGGGGGGGLGSFLGGAATGVLGSALYGMLNQRSHHSDSGSHWSGGGGGFSGGDSGGGGFDSGGSSGGDSGGSFGGDSFDGGYSGGGGATGEW